MRKLILLSLMAAVAVPAAASAQSRNEIRRDRMAPRRLEIEPARISDQLLDTFILERAGTSAFRFRLTGTRVTTMRRCSRRRELARTLSVP